MGSCMGIDVAFAPQQVARPTCSKRGDLQSTAATSIYQSFASFRTTTYSGTLTVNAAGATKTRIETAAKKALASKLGVAEDSISVTATESRRLAASLQRRLAGTWSVSFTIVAPASQLATVDTKAKELKADTSGLQTVMS